MCNVIHFFFKCQHLLGLRRSRCKGTKHKMTRTSIRAACTAESFLTIYFQTDCSPCEHKLWESEWESKLGRARAFLIKLIEKRMYGVEDITALVKELEEQYYVASWDARNMQIPSHAFKKSVARVSITYHQTARSPLTQEVRPEDVVDPKKHNKDWREMDENDYDGDYIASTDPIHPVSTDYSHPLDDDDGSWIFNHFSPEEMEPTAGDLDFDQNGWSWESNDHVNDSDSEKGGMPMIAKSPEENTTLQIDGNDLIAWGPEASASSTLSKISMDGLSMEQKHAKEQKELMIDAFWAVVNESTEPQRQSDSEMEDLNLILRSLDISQDTPTPSTPCTPTKSPHMWVDGPSDALHTPPSTPTRPTTPPSPNSTRTVYNKQRKFLKKRLQEDANKNKYYSDLLLISRWEAKASEGPDGRFIAEPQMVRAGGGGGGGVGGNGWFQ
ncbi:uncharacterized protein J4E92_005123 [Alternaria infectoria]|uniref:uncharacterized protein n=1 Tax=Alternaria infectoria TaxID=45303 RepID=UPI002220BD81|nr:uncharacterized protein J4E92_005123 [Alternaria infectoria]KAI4929459.1 hypothetical protein J4E92_005123 [Alternaria infectoria]